MNLRQMPEASNALLEDALLNGSVFKLLIYCS